MRDSTLDRRIWFTPPILGGVARGFKAAFAHEPTDLIRGAAIGEISTGLIQNSALILRVGLRTPIFGGAIREVKAELRPNPSELVKTEGVGRRFPRDQGCIPP